MSNKKYYWLKLKDDFFNQKEIKRLRRIAGGDTYTIIYLKMLLLSLKNEGKIYFDEVCEDFADELSLEIDEDIENVKMTLSYLHSKGLLEIVNENEYFMSDIPTMIGSESDSAKRVRKHREKKKALQSNVESLPSNIEVTNGNTEIEIDKEIEKEKEIDKEKEKIPYVEIVAYLNDVSNSSYRSSTGKTQELIRARWNEGFRLDDFKKVIDIKCAEWINDSKMNKFLRPTTLFGTNFESYLNQKGAKSNARTKSNYDGYNFDKQQEPAF